MAACGLARLCERFRRLRRPIASRRDQRVAVGHVQLASLARRARRHSSRPLVRHSDRLAEMRDCLLESRAPQRLVAGLAPPFDRKIVEASLGEMMRDRLGFGRRAFAQDFGSVRVERLAAALEQAVVGGVLDQRMLEAVVRLRSIALDEQNVGLGEPLQRRLQRAFVEAGHGSEQRIRESAPQHCADLRSLARGPEPIEPCGERLLQGRRNRLGAALFAALQQEARHLLDEERDAAGALAHPFDDVPWQRMTGREFTNHLRDLHAIKRRQRDRSYGATSRSMAGGTPAASSR